MDNPAKPKTTNDTGSPTDTVEFTVILSPQTLTKRYELADGGPKATGSPYLTSGQAHRFPVLMSDFGEQFAEVLKALSPNSCLICAPMIKSIKGDVAEITTREQFAQGRQGQGVPVIYRGKEHFQYEPGHPAVLGLDHDRKDLPPDLQDRLDKAGGPMAVLASVCSDLATACQISRPSSSNGVIADETGKTSLGGGLHTYFPIVDGGDAAGFVARLNALCIIGGWGYAHVSKNGSVSIRSLLDTAASGVPERLWFEGNAVLGEGLSHIPGARTPSWQIGPILDTRTALPELDADQQRKQFEIEMSLREEVAERAAEIRRRRAVELGESAKQRGDHAAMSDRVMSDLFDAEDRGVLNGRHELRLDNGTHVLVKDVLANPTHYHRATCADPLEPGDRGVRNKAIIYTEGKTPQLYTHKHGGRLYKLGYDELDVIQAIRNAETEGRDSSLVVQAMVQNIIFSGGGWGQVKRETAVDGAVALGFRDAAPETTNDDPSVESSDERLDDDPIIDAMMRELNEKYAVVAEGGRTSIVRQAYNADLRRTTIVCMRAEGFMLLLANKTIKRANGTKNGEVVYRTVKTAQLWLQHPKRRTCDNGFGLDPNNKLPPGIYNLWQGFGVAEKQGDWSRLRALIRDILANGNEEHERYIIQWLAHLVQRPHKSPGVAIVFRGAQGVGKGTLGRAIMRMMRPHAMQITNPKHLLGAFNAHMRDILFLFADEAFFAGDRANEGVLKGLITEEFRINEGKGQDATVGINRIHLMMASNNEWVIPASADARRYAVFEVASTHMQDAEYFADINDEMDIHGDAAGIAAMLYDLRRIPLDLPFIRKAPETVGLQQQRIASLRGPAKWLFDVLTRGFVEKASPRAWSENSTVEELFSSYLEWSKEMRESYPANRHEVGKLLASMFTQHRPRARTKDGTPVRVNEYRLGTLEAARSVFAEKQALGNPWTDNDNTVGTTALPTKEDLK